MRRWLKRLLIPLAILIALPVGFYFYAQWQGERELQAAIAELDAEGPWRWEELEAQRAALDPKNDIRPLVLEVHRQVSGGFFTRKAIEVALERPPHHLIPPDDAEAFSEAMKSVEEALALARKLADMPEARLHLAWPPGAPWPDLDVVQKARSTSYVLNCGAAWYAQQGDLDAALDCCLAMQRLAATLQEEPTLIAHLVRLAIQANALGALERALAQGQPAPQRLAQVQTAWEEFDRERGLVNAFRGERAGSHRMFEQFAGGKLDVRNFLRGIGSNRSTLDFMEEKYFLASLKRSHAWTLRHMTAMLQSFELPLAERIASGKELEKRIWKEAPPLARMLTPAMLKVIEDHNRGETRTRCAITALAAERFRRDHKLWPKALDELCPKYLAKTFEDPWTGGPLQYRATADGVVIYSVGPQAKYGGRYWDEQPRDSMAQSYEFRLWNVPQRRQLVAAEAGGP